MPEMSTKFVPKHKGDKNPNPKLLKFVRHVTDRVPGKIKMTTDAPEYWGLACIFEDEMDAVTREASLDLLLDLLPGNFFKVREHHSYAELHEWNAKKHYTPDDKSFDELLDKLAFFGMLEYDYGDKYTKEGPVAGTSFERDARIYWVPMFVPGSAEYTNMNVELMDKHPELAMFFERMTFLPLEKVTPLVPMGGSGIGMHVIPVEKAISMENQTADIEHISYWLKRYEGHLAVGICSCRYGRKKLEEGCADDYRDWCIGVGDMAEYLVETNRGHYITYDEAMAILKKAEDHGFVHQVTNIDGEGKIFAICNCNIKICNALRTSQLFNTPNMSRSAYVAKVEPANCVACGRCVEYCPAGAVRLGQKLCTKHGEQTYPKQELPDAKKWGPEKWDEDYRDKNRINCYPTGTAPCKTACPAHIAVQGYLKKAAEGKYTEALELIKRENPFPAVCGRVCNRRCEDACTRGTIDQPIAIDAVKKFIAEQDLKAETRFVPEVNICSNVQQQWEEKIAIIGGGPAGLSCAYYLATMGYKPTVFEKNEIPGGMLQYGIPSYKLDKSVIKAEIDIMREIGVEIHTGVEVGKDITIQQLREQGYKGFYVAIGCQGGKLPGIPGEDFFGVITAIDFLHGANCGKWFSNLANEIKGVSYGLSTERLYDIEERKIVVVGGGNVAIDAARVAKRSGAASVTMVSLETEDIMPASLEERREAREDGVEIKTGWGPKEVIGEHVWWHEERNGNDVELVGEKVNGIVFKKCTSVYDKEHRFKPQYNEDELIVLDADMVIFAIGQTVILKDLLKDTKVEFVRGVYPVADKLTYQTAEEDIFVGGDCFTGPKFAIDAIAAGKEAAESLHRYVQHGHMTIGRNRRDFIELDKDDIVVESYDNSSRQVEGVSEQTDKFREYTLMLTEEQVRTETSRCLSCGASVVDENRCIGCGICTTKCAFDAIHLFREHPEASIMRTSEDKFSGILPYMLKRAAKIVFKK
ncbi:MAG: FAD-dependent oxidoreductase [Bacteroidales bacterium]|nr:FAD-dependent oxidoreductase [Bacteroidales bacterium]